MRTEYALLAYFDHETELELQQFWFELNELGITDYGVIVKNRRPHITLADYQNIDIEKLSLKIQQYFHYQTQVQIHLNTWGSFIGNKMLYLAPTMTKELLELHSNYHEKFKEFNQNPNSYYLPDRWVPHCTIAGHLTDERMIKVFGYCQRRVRCIHTKIVEVGLVEITIDKDGNIIKDQLIISKELKMLN